MTVSTRPVRDRDVRFVVGAWTTSMRLSHTSGMIAMADWDTIMYQQVKRLMLSPGCQCIVACDPDEADPVADVYGFLAYDVSGPIPYVHYCYVKQHHRRSGIARLMMRATGIDLDKPWNYTVKTAVVTQLQPKIRRARWEPMMARFSNPSTEKSNGR